MVYNLFCMSAPVAAFGRAPPVYQYFVHVWNRDCSNIKLKKHMRFTKCDICTVANEALDVQRRKGGMGWMTEEMANIKRTLDDHYEVSVLECVVVFLLKEQLAVHSFLHVQPCTEHSSPRTVGSMATPTNNAPPLRHGHCIAVHPR